MKIANILVATAATALVAGAASAAVSITNPATGTTYSTVLNLDAPGTPTGLVPSNTWSSLGVTITDGVNGPNTVVGNFSNLYPWLPNQNTIAGAFGNFISFDSVITNFSCQLWAPPSGGPFGGGAVISALDANGNFIDGVSITAAWGGLGNTWINIDATAGDGIRGLYIDSGSWIGEEAFITNLSWNAVPAPGALALLGLGLAGSRRRRA